MACGVSRRRPRPLLVLSSSSPRPRRDRATATAATATATPTPTGTATATTTTTAATTTSPTPLPHPPPPALPNYSCLQHCVLNPMLYKLYQNNRTERRRLSAECEGLARTVELQGIRAGDLCGRKRLGRGWRKRWSFGCEAYWTKPLFKAGIQSTKFRLAVSGGSCGPASRSVAIQADRCEFS